jgi:hypothetical protein
MAGSFMPQLEGKARMSEGIQPSHGRGCPQTRHSSINRPEMRQFWLETSASAIHMFLGKHEHGGWKVRLLF